MKANLKIQNFGPIKSLDIEISKFNILIGPHASGKSTIAKVLCIIHMNDFSLFMDPSNKRDIAFLKPLLAFYKIENFYQKNTYWYFEDESLTFKLQNEEITINYHKSPNAGQIESYYFPAERIALPMISESLFELNLAESSLPKYFLQFGRDFLIAKKTQNVFNLPLLEVEFTSADGKNRVILKNRRSILLDETSSAIQANLPLLLILQYPVKNASLFVVEELELHNFPNLQKKLLYYLVHRMKHPKLKDAYVMLPTHSPYLLSAANNLLFAAKAGEHDPVPVNRIINKESWIEQEDFTAYYINDGGATSIVDKETGLIHENMLDSISEELADEFDALMNLYKPAKA